MRDALSIEDIITIRFSYEQCVASIRLPSRSMICGLLSMTVLLINGVINLI